MSQKTYTPVAAISNAGDATSDKLVTILVGQGELGGERRHRLGGLAARAFKIAALAMPAATAELGEQGWAEIDAASVETWEAIAAAGDVDRGDEPCSQPCLATYAAFVTACGDTGKGEAVRLFALHASHYCRVLRALDGASFAELAAVPMTRSSAWTLRLARSPAWRGLATTWPGLPPNTSPTLMSASKKSCIKPSTESRS